VIKIEKIINALIRNSVIIAFELDTKKLIELKD